MRNGGDVGVWEHQNPFPLVLQGCWELQLNHIHENLFVCCFSQSASKAHLKLTKYKENAFQSKTVLCHYAK